MQKHKRPVFDTLQTFLKEPPRYINIVLGPRQVGKTTMVREIFKSLDQATFVATDNPSDIPTSTLTAPNLIGSAPTAEWIVHHWIAARTKAKTTQKPCYLAIDEIQKIPNWSNLIKGLWDEDRAHDTPLHIVLLGSSPWLMQRGLSESLAGRYETIPVTHWSYSEMQEAFNFSLEDYIYFGGYPGAPAIQDETRWRRYIRDAIISPIIEKDILETTQINKPALLKNLFELGCGHYSGQIIALDKIMGNLQDAGNVTTLAHYLDLLSHAKLLVGIQNQNGPIPRKRSSKPKLNTYNTALMSALNPHTFTEAKQDGAYWGHLFESCAGAHILNTCPDDGQVNYFRESKGNHEVDFVITKDKDHLAIEVKSGKPGKANSGLALFKQKYPDAKTMVVSKQDIPLQDFLSKPVWDWFSEA